jgi:hypothetical protein
LTIPTPSDDPSSVLTAPSISRIAPTAVEALWEEQRSARPRGRAARILGRSPLADTARDVFSAALGEARVAERLRRLSTSGEPWRVLHAIPALPGEPEIDHLVVGPAGVFALDCATRDESAPGVVTRRPDAEARRTSELLSQALGRPIVVHPVLVTVDAGERPAPADSAGVTIVGVDRMSRHLRSLPPVQSVDDVREITRIALQPRTWRVGGAPAAPVGRVAGSHSHPTASELGFWFARLRSETMAARRVRIAWVTTTGGVLLATAAIAPMLVAQLLG